MTVTLHHAEALATLRAMPDNSVDSIVTDPPYGLSNTDPAHVAETIIRWAQGDREYVPAGKGFMGAEWDHTPRADGRCSCKTDHVARLLAEVNVTEPRGGGAS